MTQKARRTLPQGSVWTGPELLFDENISGTDLKVFLGLCSYANITTDSTFVSQTTLAERLNMSRKSVVTSLNKLKEHGYISVEARYRKTSKGKTTNVYTIINKPDQTESEVSETGETEEPSTKQPVAPNQGTLFNIPKASQQTYGDTREARLRKLDEIAQRSMQGLAVDTSVIETIDLCYYYQRAHKDIVGYHVSVNRTEGQAKGRATSDYYLDQFMERYSVTKLEMITLIPTILTKFRELCEAEGRKKSEWLFHIGLLTWTGSNADIEKIMNGVKPKTNDKYAHLDDLPVTPTPKQGNQSSGIVF